MFNVLQQQQTMLKRLVYYRRVMNERPEGYRKFKQTVSIPNIKKALSHITDGTYGTCEECDEQIPEQRLLAVPAALLCVPCQVAQEGKIKKRR